ncbi:hypothetical protein ACROYT_G043991 [Oculina patagonica]
MTREDDEKKELQRKIRNGWLDHLFGKRVVEAEPTPSQETKSKYTETARLHERIGGIDFVPAFRSRGWPKVAREWLKRERKWPSPEMVNKVIQEGYHLVVKPPKNSGNPDCDFRISFSHAEYLLSQKMNDIQRECYRCLKKYHRAYLSTQPASLVSFHLKNLLLQTIEETGAEMWTESNQSGLHDEAPREPFGSSYKEGFAAFLQLIDMAFNDPDLRLEDLDTLERSLVKDLREIVRNHDIPVGDLPRIFNISWDMAYYKVWISTEPDMRRRMLVGIQGQVEMMKHMLKQEVAAGSDSEVAVLRMFDPSADEPFDLNHIMPADAVTQFLTRFVSSVAAKTSSRTSNQSG